MRLLCVLLILNGLFLVGHSQDSISIENNIFKTSQLKRGIYYNYTQFKTNSPATTTAFTINRITKSKKDACGRVELTFEPRSENSEIHTPNKHIWGFCTGDSVYVNNDLFSSIEGYDHLLKLGYPISYFYSYVLMRDENIERVRMASQFGVIGAISATIPYNRLMAIDNRSGEVIRLDDKGFVRLFQDDQAILRRYNILKTNENKDKFLIFLIDEYNQKHRND